MDRSTAAQTRLTRAVFLAIGLLAVALLLPGLRPWAWVFGTLVVVVSAVAVVVFTRARRRAGQG